jgi:hypothetical protein
MTGHPAVAGSLTTAYMTSAPEQVNLKTGKLV